MISRGPSLTERVRRHIKEAIAAKRFEGGRIPAEADLAAQLGVSRTTVRDALSRLEHEKAITRRQGAGTFVNQPGLRIKSKLDEIWSYEEALKAHGYEPSVQVLDVRTEAADGPTAETLGLAEGGPVIVTEKLFRQDGSPVILARNRVPKALVAGEVDEADARAPIWDFIGARCGRALSYYVSELTPVALSGAAAKTLDAAERAPAIRFDEVGYDNGNQPILAATSWFRDELIRFRLIRRRTAP